jgi:hypothetical protein
MRKPADLASSPQALGEETAVDLNRWRGSASYSAGRHPAAGTNAIVGREVSGHAKSHAEE